MTGRAPAQQPEGWTPSAASRVKWLSIDRLNIVVPAAPIDEAAAAAAFTGDASPTYPIADKNGRIIDEIPPDEFWSHSTGAARLRPEDYSQERTGEQ